VPKVLFPLPFIDDAAVPVPELSEVASNSVDGGVIISWCILFSLLFIPCFPAVISSSTISLI
jgi:hypothetical protein